MQQQRGARITGPYWNKHREFWCATISNDRGGCTTRKLGAKCRHEAEEEVEALRTELLPALSTREVITVAIDRYERYLQDVKKNRSKSRTETIRRMRLFFEADKGGSRRLPYWTEERCSARYEAFATHVSVDYHRNVLIQARTFMVWCMAKPRCWISANPLADVKGQGKRRHGKPQLRPQEALTWRDKAVELARGGDRGAVAALLLLDSGARPGEVITRQVRDLVAEASFVLVDDVTEGEGESWGTKTEKAKRPLGPLPQDLRELLQAQAQGKLPGAYLFPARRGRRKGGPHDGGWMADQVKRICRLAQVPERCAHSMRGLRTTLDILAGRAVREVAAERGHEDARTTLTSYAAPGAAELAQQDRYLRLVQGGRR